MKIINQSLEPNDAKSRRAIKPVISYPIDNLPAYDANLYQSARDNMNLIESIISLKYSFMNYLVLKHIIWKWRS